jgi:hypothetical protein
MRNPSPNPPSPFSSVIGAESQRLLASPARAQRQIPKLPYKVLDAPQLKDDYYLNLGAPRLPRTATATITATHRRRPLLAIAPRDVDAAVLCGFS